jgi:hypothetical protein
MRFASTRSSNALPTYINDIIYLFYGYLLVCLLVSGRHHKAISTVTDLLDELVLAINDEGLACNHNGADTCTFERMFALRDHGLRLLLLGLLLFHFEIRIELALFLAKDMV